MPKNFRTQYTHEEKRRIEEFKNNNYSYAQDEIN